MLTTLGVWHEVAPHLVRAGNVRDALMYVARAKPLWASCMAAMRSWKRPCEWSTRSPPANTHPPIVYPIALTRSAQRGAATFAAYLGQLWPEL